METFFIGRLDEVPNKIGNLYQYNHDPPKSSVSDCGSVVSDHATACFSPAYTSRRHGSFPETLAVELSEGEKVYEVIRHRFLTCLGPLGNRTTVVGVHRNNWSRVSAQARLQCFHVHSRALANKHGGSSNVKFAWFGGDKERIENIMAHGFSHFEVKDNSNGAVFLSPDDAPSDSVEGSIVDDDGLKHVLLCRIILGRSEVVQPDSNQTHPSSEEIDSGVDDIEKPKKYIIWSTNMNCHILPEYIVSFRVSAPAPPLKDCSRMTMNMPKSPWMSFASLISNLARFLPTNDISLINKYHKQYKEKKITRRELIQKVRQITGDKLLVAVIKSFRNAKEPKGSIGSVHNRNTNQE